MSTSPTSRPPALPSAAVDRVFARLLAIFGAQRTAAAWDAVPQADRLAVWSAAIGRAVWCRQRQAFDLQAVADALDELASEPTSWLPSAGEFADRCERHAQRPGRRLALPVPSRTADDLARGREQMARIRQMVAGIGRTKAEPLEQSTQAPACTCAVGLARSGALCPTCSAFGRGADDRAVRRELGAAAGTDPSRARAVA